jgi:hypothetical protein
MHPRVTGPAPTEPTHKAYADPITRASPPVRPGPDRHRPGRPAPWLPGGPAPLCGLSRGPLRVANTAAAANSGKQPRQPAATPPRPTHEEAVTNSIRRLRRALARRAKPPGLAELQARQPKGQQPQLASRPGRDGLAGRSSSTPQPRRAWWRAGQARSRDHDPRRRMMTMAPAAAAHHPAVHPLPAQPGRVLGQPRQRPCGPPSLVPVLLPATGPALPSRDPVRR